MILFLFHYHAAAPGAGRLGPAAVHPLSPTAGRGGIIISFGDKAKRAASLVAPRNRAAAMAQ